MKIKSFTPVLLLLLLVALAPGSAVAQQGSTADSAAGSCDAVNPITPGVTVTDDLSDEVAAHTDIAEVSTSISGGKILTAVFHLRDLPQTLTFDRPGAAPGSIEYSWEVWVDLDGDPGTGFMGGFEYLVSAYHTVSEEDSGGNQAVAIEGELKASTWSLGIDGPHPVLNAKVELSPEADTITITGGVPRLKPEVRLAFKSTDALGGSDQVGCFPSFGERVTLGGCESGPSALLPGQSAIDEISHSLPRHIDITEVNTYLSDGVLTVVFHLRDLPDRLTFNRTGVSEGQMEYIWQVSVDVDNDKRPALERPTLRLWPSTSRPHPKLEPIARSPSRMERRPPAGNCHQMATSEVCLSVAPLWKRLPKPTQLLSAGPFMESRRNRDLHSGSTTICTGPIQLDVSRRLSGRMRPLRVVLWKPLARAIP